MSKNLEISPMGTSGEIMIDNDLERVSVLHGSFRLKAHDSQKVYTVQQGEKINVHRNNSEITVQKFKLSDKSLQYLQNFPKTLAKEFNNTNIKKLPKKKKKLPVTQYGTIQTVISRSGTRYTGYVYDYKDYILVETQSQKIKIAKKDIESIE